MSFSGISSFFRTGHSELQNFKELELQNFGASEFQGIFQGIFSQENVFR